MLKEHLDNIKEGYSALLQPPAPPAPPAEATMLGKLRLFMVHFLVKRE